MRAMYAQKDSGSHSNTQGAPCLVIIQCVNEAHAESLDKDINHGALDPTVYKQFELKRDGIFLRINIHDVNINAFVNSFLLALSAVIKNFVSAEKKESAIAFHVSGKEEAAVAVCLASQGLWSAEFSFSSQNEKSKFDKKKLEIQNKIKENSLNKSDEKK